MDLDKVLRDLNAEKRWLEKVIGAVEIASGSPAHRLIRILNQRLWAGRKGSLRLGTRQRNELTKLAQIVQQNGREASSRGRSS